MKKIFLFMLAGLLFFSHSIVTNAAHTHNDGCYSIQGAHTHTGNSVNGGGCYGAIVYHAHTGNPADGGGCYGATVYHIHEGQAGQAAANGCYTNQSAETGICTITPYWSFTNHDGPDVYCSHCNTTVNTYVYSGSSKHSSCGQGTVPNHDSQTTCQMCGTKLSGAGLSASSTHSYTKTVYDLGCGKTEQTIERYELSCGKTTDTIEGYSLSCGQQESAGTKVLTCTTPESVDTPAPAPTPAPTPEPVEKQEPSYTYKDLNKTMYTQTELNVRNIPSSDGALLGRLAKGDEIKVTGQCNETSWYRIDYNGSAGYVTNLYLGNEKPLEDQVSSNIADGFKEITKKPLQNSDEKEALPQETVEEIEIVEEQDEMLQEEPEQEEIVVIEDEMTPAAQFQVAAAVAGTSTATGGMLWVVFCFVFRKCKVIDTVSNEVLGTAHISKRQKYFVVNVPDKIYNACNSQVTLEFTEKFVQKNEGVKLVVNLGEYEYQQRISNNVVITIEEN